jgi:hypothetical protein
MTSINAQQRYDIFVETHDVATASNNPTRTSRIANITEESAREQIDAVVPCYRPPVDVPYRPFGLKSTVYSSLSPSALFLLFFGRLLDLLLYHTNIAIQGQLWNGHPIRPILEIEMKRWLACRIDMAKFGPRKASFRHFWSSGRLSIKLLSLNRFLTIERFICLTNATEAPSEGSPWYWKVQSGLESIQQAFQTLLLPSSHICVDESSIKFHGRTREVYDLTHKPAKRGFVVYTLTSHGGLIHDFTVASRQSGIEGVKGGLTVNLATRTTRLRKQGATGATATEVHLPPIKAMVYNLCDRLRSRDRYQPFVCFLDNLFTDVPLARALISLGIGICGTTRRNTPGFPAVLLAIKYRFPQLLPDNTISTQAVDDIVNCIIWNDHLQGNIVSFISTVHRNNAWLHTSRKCSGLHPTRHTPGGFQLIDIDQPAIAVDYNTFMGSTDKANQYRAYSTVRVAGQPSKTKKILEFMIDSCQNNAFLVWQRYQPPDHINSRSHEYFINELVEGLLLQPGKVHTPFHRSNRTYCAWKDCSPRGYTQRTPLGEIINSTGQFRGSKTYDYCQECMKALCIERGCWGSYHDAHNLITRPEDRR